jgi:YegS/Rv2252/BmrU family lipid kinase
MKVKIVLNPYAKRWQARAQIPAVEAACQAAGLQYEVAITERPGQGIVLAEQAAAAGFDAVVAAGGDGTINEVVNGLLRVSSGRPTIPLGILPLGTANDFPKMAGLPDGLEASARVIAAGHTRQVDAGLVSDGASHRYFINNSAAAMEPMVTLENIKMTRLTGEVRYLVALGRAIAKLKAWQMEITWDGGGYEGPAYLLSVCNSPRTGGFSMAPGAAIDDGRFNFVFAPEVPKRTVLAVLVRLMQGKHIYHSAVTYGETTRLSLESRPGTPVHADGEIVSESADTVHYEILPGVVMLLSPKIWDTDLHG